MIFINLKWYSVIWNDDNEYIWHAVPLIIVDCWSIENFFEKFYLVDEMSSNNIKPIFYYFNPKLNEIILRKNEEGEIQEWNSGNGANSFHKFIQLFSEIFSEIRSKFLHWNVTLFLFIYSFTTTNIFEYFFVIK